jgi:hypothetical protein
LEPRKANVFDSFLKEETWYKELKSRRANVFGSSFKKNKLDRHIKQSVDSYVLKRTLIGTIVRDLYRKLDEADD